MGSARSRLCPTASNFGFRKTPRSYWEGEQTVPPPCTCPINGSEASGIELASALTFTKHVPAFQPGRKRNTSWVKVFVFLFF